jgi:hypothetical protein
MILGRGLTAFTKRADRRNWTCLNIAKGVARDKGFTYYGPVNITLSLPEELVKRIRKIAVDRDTTLTGLVREYLNELARQEAAAGRKRREREALERSFEQFQYRIGNRTWKREDLHERA